MATVKLSLRNSELFTFSMSYRLSVQTICIAIGSFGVLVRKIISNKNVLWWTASNKSLALLIVTGLIYYHSTFSVNTIRDTCSNIVITSLGYMRVELYVLKENISKTYLNYTI
jgi:hypothetical protein